MSITTTQLLGPADASLYRVEVGRYRDRWYTDPLPTCPIAEASDWEGPSYSIVKGASGKDWSFVSLGRAADDIFSDRRHYFDLSRNRIYDRLNSANKRGLEEAAGRGTIIHLWFEDGLSGQSLRTLSDLDLTAHRVPPASREVAELYRASVSQFFDTYQPELVVSEAVCLDRSLNAVGYGCTGDAGIVIEGDLFAADWKSRGVDSGHGCYPEEAAQVGGAFAGAEYMIVADDDGARRAPLPDFAGGLVVSVKHDGCRIYPVDLKQARRHFEAMHTWWCARRDERKAAGRAWPARKIAAPASPAVEQRTPEPASTAGSGDERREKLLARYNALNDTEKAAFRKINVHGTTDLDAVEKALDEVDGFNRETPPLAKEPPAPCPVTASPPDEGGEVSAADVAALEKRFGELSEEAKAWTGALVAQGRESFPWRIKDRPTVRRYEIYRGVLALARQMDAADYEAVTREQVEATMNAIARGLLGEATGREEVEQESIPLGAALGSCNDDEAARFAKLVNEYPGL